MLDAERSQTKEKSPPPEREAATLVGEGEGAASYLTVPRRPFGVDLGANPARMLQRIDEAPVRAPCGRVEAEVVAIRPWFPWDGKGPIVRAG